MLIVIPCYSEYDYYNDDTMDVESFSCSYNQNKLRGDYIGGPDQCRGTTGKSSELLPVLLRASC